MPKDGMKIAIGAGVLIGIGTLVYFTTRAEAKPPPPEPGLANLYGRVTDAVTGKAILGVLVTLDGLQVYTDSGGNYVFTNVEPGGYTVIFEKTGYETAIY